MHLTFQTHLVLGFFLAFIRASAWILVCPPFATRAIPTIAKVGLAAGLGLACMHVAAIGPLPTDVPGLIGAITTQVVTGSAMGFAVSVLFSSIQGAGMLLDMFSGMNLPPALDPLSLNQVPLIGQFYGLVATTLLFASGADLLLADGFVTSFHAVGVSLLSLGALDQLLTHDLTAFFAASVEIAAPLVAVLFATQIVLGLLAKAAPQMNVLLLGMPLQVLLTLGLLGIGLRAMPAELANIIGRALTQTAISAGG